MNEYLHNSFLHSGTACLVMLALASTVAYAAESEFDGSDQVAVETNTTKPVSTELSVKPLDQIDYPADRPSWLEDENENDEFLEGEDTRVIVVTDPSETLQLCLDKLEASQKVEVDKFVKSITKSDSFDFHLVNKDWIEERLVTNSYGGTLEQGGMEMYEQAVELTFTPEIEQEIKSAWNEIKLAREKEVVKDRLGVMAFLTFVGTTLLVCLSMFLCMLSRRAERILRAEVVAPVSPGTVAFATMLNPVEPPTARPVTAQSDRSYDADSAGKPNVLVAPIICTAIYLLTTPGGYFWPKWVWFGCIVMPFFASWTGKSCQSAK